MATFVWAEAAPAKANIPKQSKPVRRAEKLGIPKNSLKLLRKNQISIPGLIAA
jgi:hypothetical protein